MRNAARAIPRVCSKTFPNGIVLLEILQAVKDLAVADALVAVGLEPGKDEFKSRYRVADEPQQADLRDQLRGLLQGVKVGAVVIPATHRESLGDEGLFGLTKIINANSFVDSNHEAFFDEGIAFSGACLQNFRDAIPACRINARQDSRTIGGIQMADLAAHAMGTMLLEEQGLVSKRVRAGENSGYSPELELPLGFELWSTLRYSFFRSPLPMGDNNPPSLIPERWYNVEDHGLYIAPSCSPELRSAAVKRFGEVYLGCIH